MVARGDWSEDKRFPNEFSALYEADHEAGRFTFTINDPETLARLSRAAQFSEQSNGEFLAEAMESFIKCAETDEMVFHPVTGEPVVRAEEIPRIRAKEEITEPTLPEQRGERPRRWKLSEPYESEWQKKELFAQPLPTPEPGGYVAIHAVAPTQDDCGFEYRVELRGKEAAYLREIAEGLEMPFEDFVQKLLEGAFQAEGLRDKALPKLQDEAILENDLDEDSLVRLQRIAEIKGSPLAELIGDDLRSTITMYEDDWLYHPDTGEVIGDRLQFRQGMNFPCRITARPLSEQAQKGGAQ